MSCKLKKSAKAARLIGFILTVILALSTLVSCVNLEKETEEGNNSLLENNVAQENPVTQDNLEQQYRLGDEDYILVEEGGDFVRFSSGGITANGAVVSGSAATIKKSGDFVISGTGSDNRLIIDCEGEVGLIFDNLTLNSASGPAVLIVSASAVKLTVKKDTVNYISDADVYTADYTQYTAAFFSKSGLTINGEGTLKITGNNNNALQCKKILKIAGCNLEIESADDGIVAKSGFNIGGGKLNITSAGDGINVSEETQDVGFLAVSGGVINIISGDDGLQAGTGVIIAGGEIDITSGGGAQTTSADSKKGIKSGSYVAISAGVITADCADDAVHSDGWAAVYGGELYLRTGDDGIHAGGELKIVGGKINITKSYEGLEGENINISGGEIVISATDDGINVAGGADSSGITGPGGKPDWNRPAETASATALTITGGYIFVNAQGDGIDSNGSIIMSGGVLAIAGPTSNGNGALDYSGSFAFTGGFLVAAGSAGMAQAPTSAQTSQYCVSAGITSASGALAVKDSDGKVLFVFNPQKSYSHIIFSTPELASGKTYSVYTGGTAGGTGANGLYTENASYTGGTLKFSVTISGYVTTYGSAGHKP